MKPSTKDKAKGAFHEAKGKLVEKIGAMTNDPALQDEGTDEKLAGKVQKTVGKVEKLVGQ